jgi:hypothetical protein
MQLLAFVGFAAAYGAVLFLMYLYLKRRLGDE